MKRSSRHRFRSSFQVLHGDLDEAICHHALYYTIWKRYGCLPERYNWKLDAPDVKFYPLRPELMESTYMLYQVSWNERVFFPLRHLVPDGWVVYDEEKGAFLKSVYFRPVSSFGPRLPCS